MKTIEIIEVVQAYLDGKTIQCKKKSGTTWGITHRPYWNFDLMEYRVKPDPLEFWLTIGTNDISSAPRVYHTNDEAKRCVGMERKIIKVVQVPE